MNDLINKPELIKLEDVKNFIDATKTDEDCDLLIKVFNL
jgi:hypothetical protein